jgi:hypothetical protein
MNNLEDFNIVGANNNKYFLILFFIFLQLAFFSVAISFAFMHYSPSAEAYKHARLALKKIKKEEAELAKSLISYKAKPSISVEEVDAQIRSLTSEIEILQKEYEISVSIYRESNIHARRDEIDGAHPALQAPQMIVNLDKFADVYSAISGTGVR